MTSVEQTELLLNQLKELMLDRRKVESILGYSTGYIDQVISKSKKEKKGPAFNPILNVLLQKTRLEEKIKLLEADNPTREVSIKMKKHLDALMQQADAMKKIIDANVSSETRQSHSESSGKNQHPRTFQKRPYPDKSEDVDPVLPPDSTHVTDNKNKG